VLVCNDIFEPDTQADRHLCCCLVGANLLIEEAKVEFPNGKDGIKVYAVWSC
jgi:hypothetical protein